MATVCDCPTSAFRLFLSNDVTVPINNGYNTNGGFKVQFDQIDLDTDGQVDLAFNVPAGGGPQAAFYNPQSSFVCKVPGWWWFEETILLKHPPGGVAPYPSNCYSAELFKYMADGTFGEQFDTYSGYISLQPVALAAQSLVTLAVSQLVQMNVGDIMSPFGTRGQQELSQTFKVLGGFNTYFSGFLVIPA